MAVHTGIDTDTGTGAVSAIGRWRHKSMIVKLRNRTDSRETGMKNVTVRQTDRHMVHMRQHAHTMRQTCI